MMPTVDPISLFAALPVFRGWFPPWLALALGVLAAAGVVLLYAREAGRLPLWRRGALAGLRVLILSGILFLVLRPTLLTETRGVRPKPIAVLVDDSQSMRAADPRPAFADRWRTAVALNLLPPDKPMPAMPSTGDVPAETPERPTRSDVARAALTNPRL